MSWREWIPGYGSKSVRKKIRDLEQEAGSIPVFFALFAHEGVKNFLFSLNTPLPGWVLSFLVAGLLAIIYIYEVEKRKAAEKAKQAKDKAKGAVTKDVQETLDEYDRE